MIGDKTDIKKLYDFNQDAKNIFSEYYTLSSDIISGKPDPSKVTKGKHFIINKSLPKPSNMETAYRYNSKTIFESLKTDRKSMNEISIMNNTDIVVKSDKNSFMIGNVFDIGDVENDILLTVDSANDYIETVKRISKPHIEIFPDEVERLVKNEIMNVSYDKFATRISRELIPGLKKNDSLEIFFNEGFISDIFEIIIKANRKSGMTSYHIYTAIYF